ncbi:MAG TPA: DUF305 domain-containing protein [Micromonosporaceae bacterium]|nr:DUF305 domain-containing protein [Micromonosporaceae bacterium]
MTVQLLPASRRARLILGALAAVVGLTLAFAAGYFGPRFTAPGDDSAEAGFARDMAQHHAQAVEMAMYGYRLSPSEQVRIMAYDMVTSQQWQIGAMQTWLEEWRLSPSRTGSAMEWMPNGAAEVQPDGRMPGMATTTELMQLQAAKGREFDILFCQLMLRHHLGGVHMAQAILKLTDHEHVRSMAEKVIATQQKENDILAHLLQDYGAKPLQ